MSESGKAINKEEQPKQITFKNAADLTLMEAMSEYNRLLQHTILKENQMIEMAKINQEQLMKINAQAEEIKSLKNPPDKGTEP